MNNDIMCDKCGMAFVNTSMLIDHLTKVHKLGYFQCQSCNKIVYNKGQFKMHMEMHSEFQKQGSTGVRNRLLY